MSGSPSRVYVARLAGLPVYDPNGDQVGKVRDVVVMLRQGTQPPRVLGLVVEVFTRRRIFLPMTRVTSVDVGHVITTGLLNMRRFEQRATEVLVLGETAGPDRDDPRDRRPGDGVRPGDGAVADPRLGAVEGRRHRGRQAVPAARASRTCSTGPTSSGFAADRGGPGRDPHAGRVRVDEAGRPGRRTARAVAQAAQGDRRRAGRRAAGRRTGGAARGRPGGDPGRPRHRAGRRRAGGDVAGRRRRPDRRAADRRRPSGC